MTTIIPATEIDLDLLVSMGRQTILESHGHSAPAHVMQAYLDEKFTRPALEKELADGNSLFHLMYYNGEPAGYSKIVLNQPLDHIPQKNITKLERLYLLQTYYDLKLGQHLLQFNIDLTKQKQQVGMWLYVWKGNDRALRFYNKVGFRIVGDGYFRLTNDHGNPNWQMFLEYEE